MRGRTYCKYENWKYGQGSKTYRRGYGAPVTNIFVTSSVKQKLLILYNASNFCSVLRYDSTNWFSCTDDNFGTGLKNSIFLDIEIMNSASYPGNSFFRGKLRCLHTVYIMFARNNKSEILQVCLINSYWNRYPRNWAENCTVIFHV